jgi:hypothetical protein
VVVVRALRTEGAREARVAPGTASASGEADGAAGPRRYCFLSEAAQGPRILWGRTRPRVIIVSFRTAVRDVFCRRRTRAGARRSTGGRPAFGDRLR